MKKCMFMHGNFNPAGSGDPAYKKWCRPGALTGRCKSRSAVGPNSMHGIPYRALCAFLWLGLISGQAPAEEVAIERIIGDTLGHSYQVKIAGEQVKAADAVKQQADAAAFPSVDLDARAAHYWGLKENSIGPNFTIPAIPDRYSSGAGLTQPLFTGGRIIRRKDLTAEERRSAQSALAARRADVVYQASVAYWSWSKAFYAAESFRAAVAWMETHDRDMRNLRAAGLATENEQLSTSVRLDQTRLRLEEALRYTRLCRATIERLTGKSLSAEAAPSRPPDDDLSAVSSEPELIQGALTNRPEVKAQQFALTAAQKNIAIQQAGYFPQLNANVRGDVAKPNQLNIPPQDEWQFDAFVGLSANWNIMDWGLTRGKINEAKARANQAGHQLSQLNEQVIFEVRQALINLENALTRVHVARRAEESAQLDLKSVTDLWQNGLARHADVLDSQSRLTDAAFDLVSARADLALGRAELAHAYGISEE